MNRELFIFSFVFSYLLIPLALSYIFISYIKSLEDKKCACSNDIRRKYVKYYGYFLIGVAIIGIFIVSLSIRNPKLMLFHNPLKILTIIINALSVYLLYQYNNFLEDNNCKCSESWKRVFIKYYSYILIFLLSFIFFVLLVTFILHIIKSDNRYIIEIKDVFNNCN